MAVLRRWKSGVSRAEWLAGAGVLVVAIGAVDWMWAQPAMSERLTWLPVAIAVVLGAGLLALAMRSHRSSVQSRPAAAGSAQGWTWSSVPTSAANSKATQQIGFRVTGVQSTDRPRFADPIRREPKAEGARPPRFTPAAARVNHRSVTDAEAAEGDDLGSGPLASDLARTSGRPIVMAPAPRQRNRPQPKPVLAGATPAPAAKSVRAVAVPEERRRGAGVSTAAPRPRRPKVDEVRSESTPAPVDDLESLANRLLGAGDMTARKEPTVAAARRGAASSDAGRARLRPAKA